jgi:hypothetical protein
MSSEPPEQLSLLHDVLRQEEHLPSRKKTTSARTIASSPDVGFVNRLIVSTTLPHSKPEDNEFVRHSGIYDLCLLAPRHVGLPYGRYPRLILAWMITTAVRRRTPLLLLGPSLSSFASAVGISPSTGAKGTLTQLRDQLIRLANLTILCTSAPTFDSPFSLPASFSGGGVHLVKQYLLWWDRPQDDQPSFCLLSTDFYQEVLAHPIPIDLAVIRGLRSPLEMDVYMWLTYRSVRASRIGRPETISWEALQRQFGAAYTEVRVFRYHLLRAIKSILSIYPEIRLRSTAAGLVLLPYPPHVRPVLYR